MVYDLVHDLVQYSHQALYAGLGGGRRGMMNISRVLHWSEVGLYDGLSPWIGRSLVTLPISVRDDRGGEHSSGVRQPKYSHRNCHHLERNDRFSAVDGGKCIQRMPKEVSNNEEGGCRMDEVTNEQNNSSEAIQSANAVQHSAYDG